MNSVKALIPFEICCIALELNFFSVKYTQYFKKNNFAWWAASSFLHLICTQLSLIIQYSTSSLKECSCTCPNCVHSSTQPFSYLGWLMLFQKVSVSLECWYKHDQCVSAVWFINTQNILTQNFELVLVANIVICGVRGHWGLCPVVGDTGTARSGKIIK